MVRVMRYVILGMIKTKFESEECEVLSEDMVGDYLDYGNLYDKAIPIYFKIGYLVDTQVNEPKKVFKECVEETRGTLTQFAIGNLKIGKKDKELYKIICKYLTEERNNLNL